MMSLWDSIKISYFVLNWTKVQLYNICRADGSFTFSSGGTNYFVGLDFNPAPQHCRADGFSHFSSGGTIYFVAQDFNPAHNNL
jgi:hypothetical protein